MKITNITRIKDKYLKFSKAIKLFRACSKCGSEDREGLSISLDNGQYLYICRNCIIHANEFNHNNPLRYFL